MMHGQKNIKLTLTVATRDKTAKCPTGKIQTNTDHKKNTRM